MHADKFTYNDTLAIISRTINAGNEIQGEKFTYNRMKADKFV